MQILRLRLEELTGTFLDSWTCLGGLYQGILPNCNIETPSKGVVWVSNDSTTVQVTSGDNLMSSAVILHSSPIVDVRDRNGPRGANLRILGNSLVVTLYQEWDEVHRHRIAEARGIAADDLKVPVFGDLRRFRHDIIHSKCLSTAKYSAKTEKLTPFIVGTEVFIDIDRWFDVRSQIESWIDTLGHQ
jgi:hypothetical protein